uniref:FERM domain-containing protein 8 n=1 Tax=Photinus pyralis TaxID=7054 RepID=A0A1Y1L1R5_PHOPY
MSDVNESQQLNSQSTSYTTVIPVEYTRRVFNTPSASGEYIVEQYRTHDDYIQTEDLSSSQGALYSVSQRVPPASTSYASLCPTEQGGYSSLASDWERDRTMSGSEGVKNGSSEAVSEKHVNDTNVTLSAPSSVAGSTSSSGGNEAIQNAVTPVCIYLYNRIALIMEVEDTSSTTNEVLCQAILNCDELNFNKPLAAQVFTLWMNSPLLELQLKPSHKPFQIQQNWRHLVEQYSHASYNRQQRDDPVVSFQRNVFFQQHMEEKIKDQKIMELLYEEAKQNILRGRYPCEVSHYIMLGGIQARIELGPYNTQIHSTHYFREEQSKYLPQHVCKSATWSWLPISSKNSAEVRLLEQFKRIPHSATNRKLIRKYLEFCWSLPFYGSAFFEGQIEQPVRGLMSLITHQDIPVLVAINSKSIYVIDDLQSTVLLGLRYEELNWDYARPSKEDDPNCLPCLFLQFLVVENGSRVSKILQVFSRQASLMDSLITTFVQQRKRKSVTDETDRPFDQSSENETHASLTSNPFTYATTNLPSLSNKLSKLTLTTFDEDGHLIGQMGSWSFSY